MGYVTQQDSPAVENIERIRHGLELALDALKEFTPGRIRSRQKSGGRGPVTEADHRVSEVLRGALVRDDEGWFSEECVDDFERMTKRRVWIVDPIDGTSDLVTGVPEWCVSVGLMDDGRAVAGGIVNPSTGELFLGSAETGVTYNGTPVRVSRRSTLQGGVVLASRREVERGEWERFKHGGFTVRPLGSIAYKLARVAAGQADVTWTFSPKHQWDIAGGVALVEAAGGFVENPDGSPIVLNRKSSRIPGLTAGAPGLRAEVRQFLEMFRAS